MGLHHSRAADIRVHKCGPLYRHLSQCVMPDFDVDTTNPSFSARTITRHPGVYLFEEKKSGKVFIGKFFGSRHNIHESEQQRLLDAEFKNLKILRNKGLRYVPNQVVRPISKARDIHSLLVENYVPGHDLDYYIQKSIYEGQHERLMKKLSMLGAFFARLHSYTTIAKKNDMKRIYLAFQEYVLTLSGQQLIDEVLQDRLLALCREWRESGMIPSDTPVLVHGDATPTNFIFNPKDGITAIDLERMHFSDNALDIGMLAAELKHHFALRALDSEGAEPFIQHLVAAYDGEMERNAPFMATLKERNPFYMAMAELRIARNQWLHIDHRRWLIEEAIRCLQR